MNIYEHNIYIYIYYVHLTSVRLEHSVCRGSLMTTCIYIYIYIYIYYRNIYISITEVFGMQFDDVV